MGTFVILKQLVVILFANFKNPNNLTNDLLILNSLIVILVVSIDFISVFAMLMVLACVTLSGAIFQSLTVSLTHVFEVRPLTPPDSTSFPLVIDMVAVKESDIDFFVTFT